MKHSDLVLVVSAEFHKGRIVETNLEATDRSVMHGLHEGGYVFVDPTPTTLETAVHECLHRAFPDWSEWKVSREASHFVRAMTAAERRDMYALYRRVVKKRRGVRKVDE